MVFLVFTMSSKGRLKRRNGPAYTDTHTEDEKREKKYDSILATQDFNLLNSLITDLSHDPPVPERRLGQNLCLRRRNAGVNDGNSVSASASHGSQGGGGAAATVESCAR
jgi:hypothetical protein